MKIQINSIHFTAQRIDLSHNTFVSVFLFRNLLLQDQDFFLYFLLEFLFVCDEVPYFRNLLVSILTLLHDFVIRRGLLFLSDFFLLFFTQRPEFLSPWSAFSLSFVHS